MIVRRVNEGFVLPRFYGVAWFDCMRRQAVCLPMPLNFIVGVARSSWYWAKHGYLEQLSGSYWDMWEQGFAAGVRKAKLDADNELAG
jgi:hypothetical protein